MGYCDVYRNLGGKLLLSVDIRIENCCLDNISISDFGKKFISDIHIYIYVYIFFFFRNLPSLLLRCTGINLLL